MRAPLATALTILALSTGAVRDARAQELHPSGVKVGDRVRVSTTGAPERRLAAVRALVADSIELVYAHGNGEARVAWQDVTLLDIDAGRRPLGAGARRGARRGFIVGLVLGGALAGTALLGCGPGQCYGLDHLALLAAPVVVAGSSGIGAVVGAAAPGHTWRRVLPGAAR